MFELLIGCNIFLKHQFIVINCVCFNLDCSSDYVSVFFFEPPIILQNFPPILRQIPFAELIVYKFFPFCQLYTKQPEVSLILMNFKAIIWKVNEARTESKPSFQETEANPLLGPNLK